MAGSMTLWDSHLLAATAGSSCPEQVNWVGVRMVLGVTNVECQAQDGGLVGVTGRATKCGCAALPFTTQGHIAEGSSARAKPGTLVWGILSHMGQWWPG